MNGLLRCVIAGAAMLCLSVYSDAAAWALIAAYVLGSAISVWAVIDTYEVNVFEDDEA